MTHPFIAFIDIDDTLVRTVGTKRIPIPKTIQHIHDLYAKGVLLFCWSSGGAQYAENVAIELGIKNIFQSFLPKPNLILDDEDVKDWRRCITVHPSSVGDDGPKEYFEKILSGNRSKLNDYASDNDTNESNYALEGQWLESLPKNLKVHFLLSLSHNLTVVSRCFINESDLKKDDITRIMACNEMLHAVTGYLQQTNADQEIFRAPMIAQSILAQSESEILMQVQQAWIYAKRDVLAKYDSMTSVVSNKEESEVLSVIASRPGMS